MSFKLEFSQNSAKEWKKLDETIKNQFRKKIKERQITPRVPKDALHGCKDCYKIKLKASGYRLVYQVKDERLIILVLKIGVRANDEIYKNLKMIFKTQI